MNHRIHLVLCINLDVLKTQPCNRKARLAYKYMYVCMYIYIYIYLGEGFVNVGKWLMLDSACSMDCIVLIHLGVEFHGS